MMSTKMRIASVLLIVMMLAAVFCMPGTAAGETEIKNADELAALMSDSAKWTGSYRLAADIDLTGRAQSSIGTYETPFTGSFDGAGHTVRGLNIEADGAAGLFGVISEASISNLTVEGTVTNVFAADSAETKIDEKYPGTGGICGVVLTGGSLTNCVNRATVNGPGNSGGLVGVVYNYGMQSVTVTGCENYGTVNSFLGNAGGLFGRIQTSSAATPAVLVSGCANRVNVSSESEDRNRIGGIAGYVRSEAGVIRIENCENEGNISGINSGEKASNAPFAGGIVGRIEVQSDSSSAVQIYTCVNTGEVSSTYVSGGIAAYMQRSAACSESATEIVQSSNSGNVTGTSFAGGIAAYTQNLCTADTHSGVFNCLNTGEVKSDACAGGIIGRQYGFDIKNSYVSGTVQEAENSGAFVGKAEGTVYCETDASYYLETVSARTVGLENMLCIELGANKVSAADAAKAETFASLDFKNIWTMSTSGPVLSVSSEEPNPEQTDSKPEQTSNEPVQTTSEPESTTSEMEQTAKESEQVTSESEQTNNVPEQTTDSSEQTSDEPQQTTGESDRTTDEPEQTSGEPDPNSENSESNVLLIVIVAAVVLVAAAVVVVLIRRKK